MRAERQALARNMSAPPRTTLTFSALAPEAGASGDRGRRRRGTVARVPSRLRRPAAEVLRAERSRATAVWRCAAPRITSGSPTPYARAERDERKRPTRAAYAHAKAAPVEALADELRDLAAAVSLCRCRAAAVRAAPADAWDRPCGRGEPVQDDRDPRAPARHGVPARCRPDRLVGDGAASARPVGCPSPRRGGPHERPLRQRGAGRAHLFVVPGGAACLLAPAAPARHRGDRHGAHRRGDARRALAAAAQSAVRRARSARPITTS